MARVVKIALFLVLGLVALAVALGEFARYRIQQSAQRGEVISPSGRLVCSEQAHMEYFRLTPLIGANIGMSTLESAEDVDRLLAAFDALELEGPETIHVAAHIPTGNTYTYTCEEERCTGGEWARAWSECGESTLGVDLGQHCIDLAVRFREQDYCLIAPFQGEQ
ncbi:hypothetical protein [Roseinatronobacter alkalisoli]|uniref:Uncharacterized protein n=1 Tax=Roseinatronobacter alkalisoli TaxID=3028235 RepID=A0ABT5T9K3_9RHOB|nr:hypothetical protein [Roseinatronobacter sp. HJB301]MDD7971405.1 hypothetical protein [Roseinatronobacter sp. HJB301]